MKIYKMTIYFKNQMKLNNKIITKINISNILYMIFSKILKSLITKKNLIIDKNYLIIDILVK